ncbi:MAG TPA: Asp23/Gls24 family envelope stress response protein [Firmicutes bacterium]|nr:Asp23/Gls24 family envelope stress response protein [Bacillota bacterium]
MGRGGNAVSEEPQVKIADDVVAALAVIAATEVEGVAGLSTGLVGDLSVALGRKVPARGVKVEVGEKEAAIDLFLVVEYGVRIPEVAQRVQEAVKHTVEEMTDLRVVEVNIHIQGVVFPHIPSD